MKVLYIQNIEGIGGSENYFLEIIPKLREKGIDVSFVAVYLESKKAAFHHFEGKLKEHKIPYHGIEVKKYYSLSPFLKLKSFFKKNKYDIIHSHLVYADFWIGMLKKFGGLKETKTISTIHGYSEEIYQEYCLKPAEAPKNRYYKLVKIAHKYIDHTYACSEGLKKFYEGIGIEVKGGMDVIEHGFSFTDYKGKVNRDNKIHLLIVGRLMPIKQHDLVINILPELIKTYPNVVLDIVGEGKERNRLEKLVDKLGVSENVVFHGFSDAVNWFYTLADIVLVPSFAEGLPLVILEAFNYGKPVIVFKTIGCEDVVEDGGNGFVVSPYDSNIYAQRLKELIKDPDLRERMGKKGKKAVDEQYNIEVMTKETLKYYKSILG
jgi:glycosyltransferase involved in cell wall biosynthesis